MTEINKYSNILVEPTENIVLAIKYAIDLKGGFEGFLEEISSSEKSVEMWLSKIEPVPLKIIVKVCKINRTKGGENLPVEIRYFDLCIKGAKIRREEMDLNTIEETTEEGEDSEAYKKALRYLMNKLNKEGKISNFKPREALRFLSTSTSIGLFVIAILWISEANNWPRNIVIPFLVIIVLIFPFLELFLIESGRQYKESTDTV